MEKARSRALTHLEYPVVDLLEDRRNEESPKQSIDTAILLLLSKICQPIEMEKVRVHNERYLTNYIREKYIFVSEIRADRFVAERLMQKKFYLSTWKK